MAQIYYDALGKNGALGFMSLLMIVQFLVNYIFYLLPPIKLRTRTKKNMQMGVSILVAASRQSWAFSRDGALPFSKFFRHISPKFGYIPVRTTVGCAVLAAVLGLLCLIAPAAAAALFSLAVAGNNLAWGTPILCRVVWGQQKFSPGPIYTGKASTPLAWLAVLFLIFGILLAMFPVGGPNPDAETMNYTCVINPAVWGGALLYYYIDAYKWFKGPQITIDLSQLTPEQEAALRAEGLKEEGGHGRLVTGDDTGSESK